MDGLRIWKSALLPSWNKKAFPFQIEILVGGCHANKKLFNFTKRIYPPLELTTMGLLSTLLGGRPKTTKMKIAGLSASAIDYVIADAGIGMLIAGSLYLNKELHPGFSSGKPKIGGSIIAVAAIGELEEAEIFKTLEATSIRDTSVLQFLTDQLIDGALREFERQCPAFAALPIGDR
ncbi:MAG: hypothetical protein KBE22_03305 [Candidatus Accumulibacter sp.]|nr:hypothetical protein [Accumulibacter sp.]